MAISATISNANAFSIAFAPLGPHAKGPWLCTSTAETWVGADRTLFSGCLLELSGSNALNAHVVAKLASNVGKVHHRAASLCILGAFALPKDQRQLL